MSFSTEAVLAVIDALNESGAPYLVTGSLASNVYAPPRATLDADFVVLMKPDELERLFARLEPHFEREPQIAFETATATTQHCLRYRATTFLIEIFEARIDDPHEQSRFQRRRAGDVEGRQAFVPTAEDVIVQKLRWFNELRRLKDRDDVRGIMLYQWDLLDWSYVERWCGEHGSSDVMNEIRREVARLQKP